jgi:hypothetical protein
LTLAGCGSKVPDRFKGLHKLSPFHANSSSGPNPLQSGKQWQLLQQDVMEVR